MRGADGRIFCFIFGKGTATADRRHTEETGLPNSWLEPQKKWPAVRSPFRWSGDPSRRGGPTLNQNSPQPYNHTRTRLRAFHINLDMNSTAHLDRSGNARLYFYGQLCGTGTCSPKAIRGPRRQSVGLETPFKKHLPLLEARGPDNAGPLEGVTHPPISKKRSR